MSQQRSEPLWRDCLAWLHRWKLVPAHHPATEPDAGPHHLVLLLRDGVILCQLVHCLDPQSVDMTQVSSHEKIQFRAPNRVAPICLQCYLPTYILTK